MRGVLLLVSIASLGCQQTSGDTPAGGDSKATAATWRGYVEVRVSANDDPMDTRMSVAAQALVLDKPQTDAERAVHQGELDYFAATRSAVPKGMCVAQGSVNPPAGGTPRFGNVGDVTIRKNGVDLLTLMRLSEGQLAYQQKQTERAEARFSLTLKYWFTKQPALDLDLGFNKAPTVTTTPAAGANGRITLTDGIDLLLRFANLPAGATPLVGTTAVRPGGAEYTCYGDESGLVKIPASVLSQFKDSAPAGTDFKLTLSTLLLSSFSFENRSGVGADFGFDEGLFTGSLLSSAGSVYYHF